MNRTLLLLFLLCGLWAAPQNNDLFKPDSVRKTIAAVEIFSNIHIDGDLAETAWQQATASPQFVQIEPYQGNAPTYATDVKVLYNRRYLYFGVIAHDPLGRRAIRATDFKRDFNFLQHDLITLAFDAFNDKRNAMSFATNAYGVQRDLLAFDDLYYDIDWNGLWQVRTTRTDTGWVAEIAIPWQTLRYPRHAGEVQQWGFNMYRNRRLTNEITAFSEFPRSYSVMRMDYAGLLTNLKPPPPRPNIQVQPYVLTSYGRFKNFEESQKERVSNTKVGGEVKWALSPNAVLDLTANTDFAQADADQQVANITRFSVFFPEKRQFFLENASLFGVGVSGMDDGSGGLMRVQPFFSRRIGLDDAGRPIPIEGGGRFVYRSAKLNYGAIAMRQQGNDINPATNFFAGRFSKNFGEQNRIGALLTLRNNAINTNIVSTVDGFFRLREAHSINAILSHATTTGGKQGVAAMAQYYFTTNRFKMWWTQSVVTKNYDPGIGFVSRTDVIGTTPGIYYYYRGSHLPFKKWLRAFEPGLGGEFYHQASTGLFIQRDVSFYPFYLNLISGAYFGYGIIHSFQRLTEPFEPLGVPIPVGSYNYLHHQILASTDPSKVASLQVLGDWGRYFNGRLAAIDARLQVAPVPHVSVVVRFNRNRFMDVGVPATTSTVDLYSIQGRFALNPRLQLTTFYQRNSENRAENYNIRFSWEYKPLSYVYLVYNRQAFDLLQKRLTEDQAIAKISYLKQF